MDLPTSSDGGHWDRPWTTQEMRDHRDQWSLACDVGLFRHLQKFSEEVRDPDQSSINRSKDDLFGSDNETDSVFTTKSDSLLNDHGGLFDEASKGLWKEKPAPKPTMIPPSLDVPPPINSIDTKPKSAIDDLFGDNESDDSDDIFAPRNSKFISKSDVTEGFQSHVNKVKGQDDNVMTSTPESNNNIPNLFEDDEDDSSLFSPIENIKNKSPEAIRSAVKKPPGILVNQADLLSSALGSRLFNRTRSDFSDSSENESVETEKDTGESVNVNGNQSTASAVNTSESMVAGNLHRGEGNEITTDSSGISVPATSVNSTSGMSLRFEEPQMESTRLLSEEIYRERVPSDSLFHPSSHQSDATENSIADSHMIHNQAHHQTRNQTTRHDDIFDNDDVFGPPPLPKANSKSKSKVNSLFDDSDSGDDLFSNTSSGSRSQKSAEQAASQYVEKPKINVSARGGSLFDADVDVFLNPSVPDIDIFAESGTCQKSKIDQPLEVASEGANVTRKIFTKRSHLFDDEDDEDLFGVSRAGRMVDTNEDKSLTASKEDVKKDSDVVKSGDVGGKEEGKSGHVESRNLFGDADEEEDDSLFGQKSDTKSPPVVGEGATTTDGPVGSKQKITGEGTKIEPPKSLRIRLPVPGEDSGQAPRRAVSGKIANLMGKMGDLKILSPTDTPPVMRRGEERQDSGQATPDKDSEDGGGFSVPKTPTSPSAPKDFASKESSLSPSVLDTESAVSFDVPAQVETLSIASKSRARIPAKRRPQSRQARQSALRHSGIDFDSPDSADGPLPDPESPTNPEEAPLDRLSSQPDVNVLKPPATLLPDDKSELSLGKESSLSITKNTLLSPSTDEEDLFDVPPDLPEDPQKDTLFSRAPILSPVSRLDDPERLRQELNKDDEEQTNEKSEEPSDPLRDSHHDPLKDPSQLFAFVTKTPSPDKSKDELTADPDDSLFTQVSKKTDSEWKKPIDLFADDDSSGDLFSGPFTKPAPKKLVKETKGSIFEDVNSDDENAVDDLFGSTSTKKSDSKTEASEVNNLGGLSPKGSTPGEEDDEDDEELFFDASEKPSDANKEEMLFPSTSRIQKTKLEDIFGDTSNGDDDIFSTKTFTGSNYSDSSDIFSKRGGENPQEGGGVVKKSVTRDLKKTAEKIVEDPLSMFRDE
ncbi:WASH complex subunit 2 isoform X2 [Diachasmimorpha longicaudata]|uniref:WASH complex subunit 2 isoform X2 n=1 Tax=Diachasmimorpha longicaudata TaxID=58733 RepID=UPI0030B8778C